ncbi:class I SAM-dependent methyltransferase [Thermodesulfobacteriota bacterium]
MMNSDIDSQKIFYNIYWQNEHFVNDLKRSRCATIFSALAKIPIKQPKILDLGCGTGWLSSMLGHFGPTVGVDLSDYAVNKAQNRYPYVKFIAADLLTWENPKNEFDIVVSQEVIEHMVDHNKFIDLVYEMLKPDGYLILTTPNPPTFNAMYKEMRSNWTVQPIENWITITGLRELLLPRFKIIKLTTIISGYGRKGVYRIANSYSFRRLWNLFGLSELYESICLSLGFGLHTFVVGQKMNK